MVVINKYEQDKARQANREINDRLMRRAQYLKPEDRSIIYGVYRNAMTPAEIAMIAGVNVETIRRKLRILLKHLSNEMFSYILSSSSDWSPERKQIAKLRFLQRRSMRDTARMSKLSMHTVRIHCEAIKAHFEAVKL